MEELCLCGERAERWRREPASAGQETGGHYGSTGTVREEQRGAASWHVWRGRVESTVYAVVVVIVAREGGGRPCDVVRAVPAHCLASIAWLRRGVRQRCTALLLLRGDCSCSPEGSGAGGHSVVYRYQIRTWRRGGGRKTSCRIGC